MNTIKLLLILILTASPLNVLTSNKQVNQPIHQTGHQIAENSNTLSSTGQSSDTNSWQSLWQEINCPDNNGHNSDDDAKCHKIHFERFSQHRRRALFCIMGKLILIISHICSILSIYIHVQ